MLHSTPPRGELVKVQRAIEKRRLSGHVQLLTHEFKERYKFENIVGRSQAVRDVLGRIVKVAPTDATVLIQGESGTGKELVAKAIHANSRRADAPYVPVNCAAISETLLESELFGHARGSFTGAISARKGLFEEADGGTFFFDLGNDPDKHNFERKFKDPDGIIFDISRNGWLGTSG